MTMSESNGRDAREQDLRARLRALGSVLLGYSGGVDSAYLAAIALETLGPARVLAVTGQSASYPAAQRTVARDVALHLGLPHLEIDTDELADPNYVANPANRCYFCKSELWSRLAAIAQERGLAVVIDGSNADDARDHRPGFRAAVEHHVRSPLLEAGLTKADIRALSHARSLVTWDQPSAPCLSSRIPYGLAVTPERLNQIERAEEILRTAGLRVFRVRHHDSCARIEVERTEMGHALARAHVLVPELEALGFARVVLDVDGYRQGSLNGPLPLVQLEAR
jgi:uncharacterized protein